MKEVLGDCHSEQVRALIEEHNKVVDYLTEVERFLADRGIAPPPLPQKITLRRRT